MVFRSLRANRVTPIGCVGSPAGRCGPRIRRHRTGSSQAARAAIRSRRSGSSGGWTAAAAFATACSAEVVAGIATLMRGSARHQRSSASGQPDRPGGGQLRRERPAQQRAFAERPHRDDAEAEVVGERQDPRPRPGAGAGSTAPGRPGSGRCASRARAPRTPTRRSAWRRGSARGPHRVRVPSTPGARATRRGCGPGAARSGRRRTPVAASRGRSRRRRSASRPSSRRTPRRATARAFAPARPRPGRTSATNRQPGSRRSKRGLHDGRRDALAIRWDVEGLPRPEADRREAETAAAEWARFRGGGPRVRCQSGPGPRPSQRCVAPRQRSMTTVRPPASAIACASSFAMPELQPEDAGALANRRPSDVRCFVRRPKDVDDVDRDVHLVQRPVDALAEELAAVRVDRDDPVALRLQVGRDAVRGLGLVARRADHRDRPARSVDVHAAAATARDRRRPGRRTCRWWSQSFGSCRQPPNRTGRTSKPTPLRSSSVVRARWSSKSP